MAVVQSICVADVPRSRLQKHIGAHVLAISRVGVPHTHLLKSTQVRLPKYLGNSIEYSLPPLSHVHL